MCVCVCVCVCVFVCVCTYRHTFAYIRMVYTTVCILTSVHTVCVSADICLHIYKYAYVYACDETRASSQAFLFKVSEATQFYFVSDTKKNEVQNVVLHTHTHTHTRARAKEVLAKRMWSGSKSERKNHWVWFRQNVNGPLAVSHFKTRFLYVLTLIVSSTSFHFCCH